MISRTQAVRMNATFCSASEQSQQIAPDRGWRARFLRFSLLLAVFLVSQFSTLADTNITTASFASLQAAVAAGGTISLSFDGTITATNTLIISNNTVLLTATNNVAINGANTNRLFQVLSNVSLTISNLTLSGGNSIGTNGLAGGNGGSTSGGSRGTAGGNGGSGVSGMGGAIFNQGSTFVFSSLFLTNSATGGNGGAGGNGGGGSFTEGNGGNGGLGGSAFGGAIYNLGTLLLSNCTVAGSGAIGGNGGAGGTGGTNGSLTGVPGTGGTGGAASGAGIYNLGIATIIGCTFDFNFSQGGSSQAAGAPLANQNGTPGSAGASGVGAGIYNLGTNTIVNCTFDQNFVAGGAGANGGGIGSGGFTGGKGGNGGSGLGGGIYNESGALVNVTNCTFADGTAMGGTNGVGGAGSANGANGSIGAALGANLFNNGGTFNLKNSIVANPTNAPNVGGALIDLNNNICSDASANFTQTNSFNTRDPKLSALATNGGSTLTIELQAGSPAIDAIFDGSAPPLDQRGFVRSQFGLRPDIGAVEFGTFSVSGRVTFAAGGAGDAAVIISVNNTNIVPAQTDANGNFNLGGLSAGTYILTPQQSGFNFTPTNVTISVPPNTNNVAFVAGVAKFTISGQITLLGTTSPFTNIATIVATGTNAANTFTNQTDALGNYSFTNLLAGTYTIAPVAVAGVTFNSTNPTVTVPASTNVNFTATLTTSTIAGKVTLSGNAFANAAVVATGTNAFNVVQSFTNTTDANGNYSFANLAGGTYIVSPKPVGGVNFPQSSASVFVPPSAANINFDGTLVLSSISGHVTLTGSALSNEVVVANGTNAFNSTSSYTNQTDATGAYSFSNLPGGTYTIAPSSIGGVSFASTNPTVTLPSSATVDFAGSLIVSTISGKITLGANSFSNVVVVANGTNAFNSTNSYTNQTDITGQYSFTNLLAGNYVVTPKPIVGITFNPISSSATLPGSTNLNFSASVIGSSITGRIMLGANGLPNAIVVANGTNAFSSTSSYTNQTDATGQYVFTNLPAGTYNITPQPVANVAFGAPIPSVSVPPNANAATINATLTTYDVFGQITKGTNGPAYANVTVLATGTNIYDTVSNYSAVSDGGGTYFLMNLPAGNYTITPQPRGFYSPASVSITLPPTTNIDFIGFTETNSLLAISHAPNSSLVKISFVKWVTNLTYRIQASPDLINWTDINTVTPDTNTVIIPVPTNGFSSRFFRAVSP